MLSLKGEFEKENIVAFPYTLIIDKSKFTKNQYMNCWGIRSVKQEIINDFERALLLIKKINKGSL